MSDEPNPHPIIFETMVFKVTKKGKDMGGEDQERYETLAQAKAGHKTVFEEWNKKK